MSASAKEAFVRLAIDAIWNWGDLDVADELFGADYMGIRAEQQQHHSGLARAVRGEGPISVAVGQLDAAADRWTLTTLGRDWIVPVRADVGGVIFDLDGTLLGRRSSFDRFVRDK
jgi:hypothetical protein